MHADDVRLAQEIMDKVLSEYRRKDNLGMKTILRDFSRDYLHLHPKFEDTLSSIKFGVTPEHPRDMHARFHEERKKADTLYMHNSGRKLMGNENDWEEVKKSYQTQKKIEDAKTLIAQEEAYKKYHTDRMKVATVVYSATTRSLKESIEIGVTPENVLKHWDEMLDYFGYVDIQHVHDEFVEAYGDAAGFLVSFSSISEHPFFRYFKKKDVSVEESPYYHDWATEQRKLIDARAKAAEGNNGGRKLMAVTQQNEDKNVAGAKESKESLGGFATLSTLNCFSSPKNPLCIPEIPPGFSLKIPLIHLSKRDKDTLESSVFKCHPWKTTWCVICLDRFYNVWQEFRFFISTIPLINYPIATITVLAPWTGIFLDWIFLVPKFKVGSLFQFVCFVYHFYDIFIVSVFLWLISKAIIPFWPVVTSTWYNIRAARISDQPSRTQLRRTNDVNKYLAKMQARGEIAGRVEAGLAVVDSSKRRRRIDTSTYETKASKVVTNHNVNNNVIVQHHHHHHHYAADDDDDEEFPGQYLTLEERKERNKEELLQIFRHIHDDDAHSSERQERIYELLKRFSELHFDLENKDHDPNYVEEIANKIDSHPIHENLRIGYQLSNYPTCSSSDVPYQQPPSRPQDFSQINMNI